VRGNRWAAVMIVVLMALSFANLILTPSIMSGVTRSLDSQVVNTILGNIVVAPVQGSPYIDDAGSAVARLSQQEGVTGVAPHLNGGARISFTPAVVGSQVNNGNWAVTGIDPAQERTVTTISQSLLSGTYLEPSDTNSILLGVEIAGGPMAQSAAFLTLGGVSAGDTVSLTFADGQQRNFTVKGIFRTRNAQADGQAFITRGEMARVLGVSSTDQATSILVKIDDESHESNTVAAFNAMGINGVARSWRDYGGGVGGVVSSFNVVSSLIGGIGLVVAGIVMFVVIYINVVNKKRQIGILRALGLNNSSIVISFMSQALFYAVLGIITGGLLFGLGIKPFFALHPISLPIGSVSLAVKAGTVITAVAGILAASVLAGIIPVLSVTRQNIIKSIWGT
jgi:putative ABC transport system permease protein